MGKSRTSPLQKTGSSIGVVGAMGGSGNTASFAQANPNGQVVTQLSVDDAQPQQVALQSQANTIFKDTDSADYHQLYNISQANDGNVKKGKKTADKKKTNKKIKK